MPFFWVACAILLNCSPFMSSPYIHNVLHSFLSVRVSPFIFKASVQRGALAITHLLSSSCTSYFYNISYMFVIFVNASVWQYCQQHSECILSDPGPIIITVIVCIISVLSLWCNLFHYVLFMQSMFNHCI